jgi:hypothetical protein
VQEGENDENARFLVDRYQHRPAEELYDTQSDPYELRNLAKNADMQAIKVGLRTKLLAWMKSQGDQGQATEMAANLRSVKTPEGMETFLASPGLTEAERKTLRTAADKD